MSLRSSLGKARRAIRKPIIAWVAKAFHKIYYHWAGPQTWERNHFHGTKVLKCPFDLWTYQEIIYETKPELIIECGTFNGGSTMYFSSLFDLMGEGQIVSIDISPQPDLPSHPRARFIRASSVAPEVVEEMKQLANGKRTMVILDSDHSRDHVYKELQAYWSLVTPGCYLVVEDGNVNGHPVFKKHGPGPTEALREFLQTNDAFEVDLERERHMVSFNPGGYLRRR